MRQTNYAGWYNFQNTDLKYSSIQVPSPHNPPVTYRICSSILCFSVFAVFLEPSVFGKAGDAERANGQLARTFIEHKLRSKTKTVSKFRDIFHHTISSIQSQREPVEQITSHQCRQASMNNRRLKRS